MTIVVVAADIVSQGKLPLPDGHLLIVRWFTLNKGSFTSPRTVEVTGAIRDVAKEYLLMYFENETKSGGGSVEDIYIFDNNTAYVTFESSEGYCAWNQLFVSFGSYINFNIFVSLCDCPSLNFFTVILLTLIAFVHF